MPTVFKAGNFKYTFTEMDIEWLARSLHGEGGPKVTREKASALSWAMFNRFMLNPRHFGTLSFTTFLKGFSQPINPNWARDGRFCKIGGKFHSTNYCSSDKLDRRDTISKGPIPEVCLAFAKEMASGTLEAPLKIYVDFASYKGMSKYGDNVGGDYFVTIPGDALRSRDNNGIPMRWLSGPVIIEEL